MERVFFTAVEVAERLRCHKETVLRDIRSGKIKASRRGKGRAPYLIHKDELERLVSETVKLAES